MPLPTMTDSAETPRQGRLLAFSMTGAMALALNACTYKSDSPPMIVPPGNFNASQAVFLSNTNSPPTAPYVYSSGGSGSYLGSRGYYHLYGYPDYYYHPAPGSRVEVVEDGSADYRAGSPAEAEEVARGGFGEGGEGEGHGGFGGEGGGHGGGE
jgi:hypothetical protein